MDENDIEVLPDGRIALILHDGKVSRGMSTHEVKQALMSQLLSHPDHVYFWGIALKMVRHSKQLELK